MRPSRPHHTPPFVRLAAIAAVILLAQPASAVDWPLRVSANGRHLVGADGRPFPYLADTAWGVFQWATLDDVRRYLTTRAGQGFSVVFAPLVFSKEASPIAGDAYRVPFVGGSLTRPNGAYFDRCRTVVAEAASRGLTMCIMPIWHTAWKDDLRAMTEAQVREYGRWVGARFAAYDNIIWCMGGDWAPTDTLDRNIVRWMAEGVTSGYPDPLLTFHPLGDRRSSTWFHSAPWLDYNMFQEKNPGSSDQYMIARLDYALTPARPTVQGEFGYEYYIDGQRWPMIDDRLIRRSCWWSFLSGAMGYTYGRRGVWQFNAQSQFSYAFEGPWDSLLDSPGARHVGHFSAFLRGRPWHRLAPDLTGTFATGGVDSGLSRTTAALADDGGFGVAYFPSTKTTTFDLRRITAGTSVDAQWLDPASGVSHRVSGAPFAKGSRAFTAPGANAAGDADWVLILTGTSGGVNQPPTAALTSPASSTYTAPATIALAATASDPEGRLARVEFWSGTTRIGTDTSAPYAFSWASVAAGTHQVVARAIDDVGAVGTSAAITITVTAPSQSPYGGIRPGIPGRIQAEHYDVGGEGVAYHDAGATNQGNVLRSDGVDLQATSGGHCVAWTTDGEWLEYSVDVATSGSYRLSLRVASASTGTAGAVTLAADGQVVAGPIALPKTGGWQAWTTVDGGIIPLAAGRRVLRLAIPDGGFNLDWFELVPEEPASFGMRVEVPPTAPPAAGAAGAAAHADLGARAEGIVATIRAAGARGPAMASWIHARMGRSSIAREGGDGGLAGS